MWREGEGHGSTEGLVKVMEDVIDNSWRKKKHNFIRRFPSFDQLSF
jgi:hypothetical protein